MVRSIVKPQRECGGKYVRIEDSNSREGSSKGGKGCGAKVLRARKSAIKAAFSSVLGRRKAVKVSGRDASIACKKDSRARALRRV